MFVGMVTLYFVGLEVGIAERLRAVRSERVQ